MINAIGTWYKNFYPNCPWNGYEYLINDKDLDFTGLHPVYDYEENPVYDWLLKKLDEAEQKDNDEIYWFLEEEINDLIDKSELVKYAPSY